MGKLTFRGGIHPYEGKELSKDHPIEKYLPKGDMVYLMSQHIGAPSVPCVKKGDQVLAGQKIADAGGFVSVPLHASVSGTVKGIEKHLNATGSMVDCIVIENDQQYQEVEYQETRLEDHPQNPKCPCNIMKQSIAVIRRCTVTDGKPE